MEVGAPSDKVGRLAGVQVATAKNHPEEQQKELQRGELFLGPLWIKNNPERTKKKNRKNNPFQHPPLGGCSGGSFWRMLV